MSQTQKIIKYCAIGLAILLIVNIVGGIFWGLVTFSSFFDNGKLKVNTNDLETLNVIKNDYNELDIEVLSSKVIIKDSEKFKVETNSKYIKIVEDGNTLEIREKKHFVNDTNNTLIVYIPVDYIFNEVSIDSGAGNIEVENLATKELSLDLGAGNVEIKNLIVTNETDIDGGAGAVKIDNGEINNLDLDIGVGKVTMNVKMTGNNDIDAGVGDTEILLLGSESNYSIRVNKGVGETLIGGKTIKNNSYVGSGSTNVSIDGGVGKIVVDFSE